MAKDDEQTNKKPISFLSNYGFFWRRDGVNWSKSPSTAKMLGQPSRKQKATLVTNFANQVGLYALYDETHQLVYFGKVDSSDKSARCLYQRLKEHCSDHLAERWSHFSWFGTNLVLKDGSLKEKSKASCQGPTSAFLDQLEAIVISISNPPSNRKGGSFKGATEYFQVRDPELGPTQEQMISSLFQNLVKAHDD